jgi:hypothetical protein
MAGPRYVCLVVAFRAIRAVFDGEFAITEGLARIIHKSVC